MIIGHVNWLDPLTNNALENINKIVGMFPRDQNQKQTPLNKNISFVRNEINQHSSEPATHAILLIWDIVFQFKKALSFQK